MDKVIMKYNPAFLSPEELVASFVVRHRELETIMRIIKENVTKSNQHILVIGPRGIGKTMLVLRVVEEVRKDAELQKKWYPLVFGEESYQVSTPGEFWLEALFHLAHKTGEEWWKRTYEELRDERDEDRLRERALAQLMDFADAVGRRILLVVENFNMLLGEQMGDSDAWKLRHTLLSECRIMLLATATHYFRWEKRGALGPEIKNSGKAMFELFKLQDLPPLDEGESGKLWASVSGKEASDERVRPLQILTGGNPRLLAIISTFAARMSLKELMDDLMQLVDDHTEYFKTHLESLPTVERRVYLGLAELWDPVTARKVAEAARLGVSKTSSLLKRLMERGVVREADGEGRAKLYQVAERMYNIYYLMRRRGGASDRVKAVVRFMVPFYGPEELVRLTQRITEEACKVGPELRKDHYIAYEGILESVLTKSMRERVMKATPHGFFEMADAPTTLKRIADRRLVTLLKEADSLSKKPNKMEKAEKLYRKAAKMAPENELTWTKLGLFLSKRPEMYDEAERALRKSCELRPESADAYLLLGWFLHKKAHRYEETEKLYRKAVELRPDYAKAHELLGELLCCFLNRYDEAAKVCQKAIELKNNDPRTWAYLGLSLSSRASRYEDAEKAFRKSIDLETNDHWTWEVFGRFLHEKLKRYDEAEKAYRKAIEIGSDCYLIWFYLGELLQKNLHRYDEAQQAYRKSIKLNPGYAGAWASLGQLLHEKLERSEEAEEAYRKAIEIEPEVAWGYFELGRVLSKLERYNEAEDAFRKAIEIEPKNAPAWAHLGRLLHMDLGRPDEAEKACRKAIEIDPAYPCPWVYLGELLQRRGNYEEAERAYRTTIEKGLYCSYACYVWENLACLLLEKLGRPTDALQLAEKYLVEHPKDSRMRNALAWTFYKYGPRDFLAQAEAWAREALTIKPDDASCKHTLASILCVTGKRSEALEHAQRYLEDTDTVKKTVDDAIELFVELAAVGYANDALKVLRGSASAGILEPLVVGLAMYAGEDVKVAAEIMEVGKDVVKRIERRRAEVQGERASEK